MCVWHWVYFLNNTDLLLFLVCFNCQSLHGPVKGSSARALGKGCRGISTTAHRPHADRVLQGWELWGAGSYRQNHIWVSQPNPALGCRWKVCPEVTLLQQWKIEAARKRLGLTTSMIHSFAWSLEGDYTLCCPFGVVYPSEYMVTVHFSVPGIAASLGHWSFYLSWMCAPLGSDAAEQGLVTGCDLPGTGTKEGRSGALKPFCCISGYLSINPVAWEWGASDLVDAETNRVIPVAFWGFWLVTAAQPRKGQKGFEVGTSYSSNDTVKGNQTSCTMWSADEIREDGPRLGGQHCTVKCALAGPRCSLAATLRQGAARMWSF